MFKKLLGETIIYGIGAIAPRLIIFVLNPLLISQIADNDFAIFTNLYALISFVNIVLSFGFETSYFRFSAEKDNEPKTFNTSFWFLFLTSSLFLFFCLLFTQPIADFLGYGENPEYIRWFALIAFFDNISVIPFAWLRFHSRPVRYSLIKVFNSVSHFILTAALLLYIPAHLLTGVGLKSPVSYPFVANLFGSILSAVLLLPVFMKLQFRFSKSLLKKMLRYSWPIMIAGLAFMVNENFDKAIQIHLIPKSEAGDYGGVYKLAVIMTLFVTAYRLGIEPFFFKQMDKANAKETYAKVTEYFTFFASVAAMGIIANVSWLKQVFIPNSTYWIALDIIPIIVLANLFFGVYYNFSTWYKVTDQTGVGTVISWTGAVFNIVANWIALKYYQSFMGSAWATFGAYVIMMVISYLWGQKKYPIPYRIKKMGFFMALLFAFSFIIVKLFNYNLWVGNSLLIIFTGSLLYSERERLAKMNIPILSRLFK